MICPSGPYRVMVDLEKRSPRSLGRRSQQLFQVSVGHWVAPSGIGSINFGLIVLDRLFPSHWHTATFIPVIGSTLKRRRTPFLGSSPA